MSAYSDLKVVSWQKADNKFLHGLKWNIRKLFICIWPNFFQPKFSFEFWNPNFGIPGDLVISEEYFPGGAVVNHLPANAGGTEMWIRSLGREDPLELLLLFSYWVMFHSLWPHGLQHTRLPSPSPCRRVCSNSYPLSWWVESGNPGQYSCLENSLGWGAWWATVHEVAESGMTEHTHTWRILVKGIPVMFLTWTLRRQYYSLLLKKRILLSVLMSPCPSISTGILSIYVFSPVYSFFFSLVVS